MAGIVKVLLTLLLLSGMVCPIYQCLMMGNATTADSVDVHSEHSAHSGTIYFNNPHLLNDRRIYLKDGSKSSVPSAKQMNSEFDNLESVYIVDESNGIASHLRKVVNDELGITAMQAKFDDQLFIPVIPSTKLQVEEMVSQLETKITSYVSILEQNSKRVQELYQHYFWMSPISCCSIEDDLLKYNEHFGAKVSFDFSCDIIPPHLDSLSFSPGQNLTSLFEQNLKLNPTIKWQYFISTENLHTEYPAHSFDGQTSCKSGDDTRHQNIYLSTIQKVSKYVVIVLDHGYSLSNKQLVIGKAVGKQLLSLLSHKDKVSLMSLSSELHYPQNDNCLKCKMVSATHEAKIHFSRFIDGLIKSKEPTNHTLGIVKAFHIIRSVLENIEDSSDIVPMIMYVSRGLLNSLMEAKAVLSAIAEENEKLKFCVVLNTFAVIDDQKPIMYEKGFLLDIAEQNFKKYNISVSDTGIVKKGMMLPINTTKYIGTLIRSIFSFLNSPPQKDVVFSPPYWESVGKGLVISLTQSCFGHGNLIGIVGLDIHLADLVEDITYFNTANKMYAFIVDLEGNTIMHPSYVRPSFASDQPMNTDIFFLENQSNFELIRKNILTLSSGKETVMSRKNDGSNSTSSHLHIRNTYVWKRVSNMPYVICIVDQKENDRIQILKPSLVPTNAEVLYHRLDLAPAPKMCHHLKQLATKDVSTLYLSPSSFQSPFQYLSQEETKRNVQSYMAYLSDGTKLIANPGLKMQIRNDVSILVRIIPEWKERFFESSLNKYIIRRYIATPAGAFLMHPGAVLDRMYDPTRRNWFIRALEYPGRIVITAPYLDVGGAGYIVTISHTIYEGKSAALHSQSDAVVAVMGIDFTHSYFYKLLLDFIPSCSFDRIICFLLDDKGYLIAHPSLIEPNGKGPVEQQHITHKEPLVANDILNHKGFVKKIVCNSFSDRSIQRFYQFNTSLDQVISNLVHGEHCSKYQIALIPGTNVFLGIVNQTCDMMTAFCPCSMVDRLCLNCHRMEQSDCECPCECPLEMDFCTGKPLKEEDNHPSCPNYPEEIRMADVDPSLVDILEPCFESKCSSRKLKQECFGVIDCDWCQLDSDGFTPFKQPFCTQQRKCFGGILGARTPYADEIIEGLPLEDMTLKNTPVGPVAGGIMGCFLVMALAVYCYRHRIQRSSQQYISTQGSNIQMSHLNNEVEEMDIQEYLPVGHSNVLVTFENPMSVSPYQMNTNYRRPPGGDSDHGYSTMTPHEDSEYTSSYVEPLAVGKERYRSPAPLSVTSSSHASSPVPQPTSNSPVQYILDLSQTTLPETRHSHHILAPVQVHMVDTQ